MQTSTDRTPPPPPEKLPNYDGTSPLIHVYVDTPFIYFPGGPGASIKIPVKGITQDGEKVAIPNPARVGVTFTPNNPPGHKVDPDGTYHIVATNGGSLGFGTVEIKTTLTTFNIDMRHPTTEDILTEPQVQVATDIPGMPRCLADEAQAYRHMDLKWSFLALKTVDNLAFINQQVNQAGAKAHVVVNRDPLRGESTDLKPGKTPTS